MECQRKMCLLGFLLAVAVMPLDASNLSQLPKSRDFPTSIGKCLEQPETLETVRGKGSISPLRKSASHGCSLLYNLRSLLQHLSNKPVDSENNGRMRNSAEHLHATWNTDNSKNKLRAFDESVGSDTPLEQKMEVYAHVTAPRLLKTVPGRLPDFKNSLPEGLLGREGEKTADSLPFPGDLLSYRSAADLLKRRPALQTFVKPESLQGRTSYNGNLPSSNTWKDELDDDHAQKNDWQLTVPGEEVSWPQKRESADWLNMISTMVRKRRRQALSINNALMTLTDMVLEHGREKLMRNRDNLRYHMYIQG